MNMNIVKYHQARIENGVFLQDVDVLAQQRPASGEPLGPWREGTITLKVDLKNAAYLLGRKAIRSKSGKCVEGQLVVTVKKRPEFS